MPEQLSVSRKRFCSSNKHLAGLPGIMGRGIDAVDIPEWACRLRVVRPRSQRHPRPGEHVNQPTALRPRGRRREVCLIALPDSLPPCFPLTGCPAWLTCVHRSFLPGIKKKKTLSYVSQLAFDGFGFSFASSRWVCCFRGGFYSVCLSSLRTSYGR